MAALEWLFQFPFTPMSVERPGTPASKSERRRWLDNRSVQVNGQIVSAKDVMPEVITEIVFFPKGKRRTTM